VYSSVGRALDF